MVVIPLPVTAAAALLLTPYSLHADTVAGTREDTIFANGIITHFSVSITPGDCVTDSTRQRGRARGGARAQCGCRLTKYYSLDSSTRVCVVDVTLLLALERLQAEQVLQ